jgi:hypothetical protein
MPRLGYWNAHSDLDWDGGAEAEDWDDMIEDPNEEISEQAVAADADRRIIETIRNDPALWGYLCGAIAPKDASTGTLRAVLRLTAEWLEEGRR